MRLRAVQNKNAQTYGVLAPADTIPNDSYWALRVEPVPEDDERTAEACTSAGVVAEYAHVTHAQFKGASSETEDFGEPLVLLVAPGEELPSLQRRCAACFLHNAACCLHNAA